MPIPEVPVEPEASTSVPSPDEAIPQPIGNPVLPQPSDHNQVIPIDEAGEPAGEPTPPASDDAGSNHEPNASIDQPDGCGIPVPDDIHDELVGWHCLDDDNLEGLDSHQGGLERYLSPKKIWISGDLKKTPMRWLSLHQPPRDNDVKSS